MCHKSWLIAGNFAFPVDLWVNFQKHAYEKGVYGGYLKNDAHAQQQNPAAKIRNSAYIWCFSKFYTSPTRRSDFFF